MIQLKKEGHTNILDSMVVINYGGKTNDLWFNLPNSTLIASFQGLYLCAYCELWDQHFCWLRGIFRARLHVAQDRRPRVHCSYWR
jgi:hypothetical protein